jgi:hypothetical protein
MLPPECRVLADVFLRLDCAQGFARKQTMKAHYLKLIEAPVHLKVWWRASHRAVLGTGAQCPRLTWIRAL